MDCDCDCDCDCCDCEECCDGCCECLSDSCHFCFYCCLFCDGDTTTSNNDCCEDEEFWTYCCSICCCYTCSAMAHINGWQMENDRSWCSPSSLVCLVLYHIPIVNCYACDWVHASASKSGTPCVCNMIDDFKKWKRERKMHATACCLAPYCCLYEDDSGVVEVSYPNFHVYKVSYPNYNAKAVSYAPRNGDSAYAYGI